MARLQTSRRAVDGRWSRSDGPGVGGDAGCCGCTASGDVSSSAVSLLAHARDASPEAFSRSEAQLVDAARTMPVEELKATVTRWRHDHADEADDDRQELYLSPTLRGRGKLAGDLNADTTQLMITALRAVQDAEMRSNDRTDTRSPARRRADALGAICRQWLDSSGRPTVAGERPHVIVTIDVESLGGGRSAPGTARSAGARLGGRLADVGAISAADALMWACDAQVTRVITDAGSRPLDVGRTTRITPPWIRKALLVRDDGCAFPDCGRPSSWCDPHPRLKRSLQHLPPDERMAQGRWVESESPRTAACAGEGAQLAEDEGPASRDD